MGIIILKIGGSVITYKERERPKVNYQNLKRIIDQLLRLNKKFVLIHGAGSFGHPIVEKTGIDKGIRKESDLIAFAETQRLQNELNCLITKELIKKGLPAFPCQASSHAMMRGGRLLKMNFGIIKNLLKLSLIPVLYGVPAFDKKMGCSILSGDQIATFLARKIKADKIIMATDVDGIFSADPKKYKNAKRIKEINRKNFQGVKKILGGSLANDVTGGMLGKVLELSKIAKKGIPSLIIHFSNIKKAFLGKRVGTIIKW